MVLLSGTERCNFSSLPGVSTPSSFGIVINGLLSPTLPPREVKSTPIRHLSVEY